MRGRKIDQKRGRKKELCAEREREGAESQYREEREKMLKKLYAHATVPVHTCTGIVATCIYTQVWTG